MMMMFPRVHACISIEQVSVGTLVGDLREDARSACDDRRPRQTNCDATRFVLLHQRPATDAPLFSVDETTGVLRCSGVVDREEICFRRETVCSVVLEVAAHYADVGAFHVVVVEVCTTFFRVHRRLSVECGPAGFCGLQVTKSKMHQP